MSNGISKRSLVLLALTLAAGVAGCKNPGSAQGRSDRADHIPAHRRIMLDGRIEEWPRQAAVIADADYIYFRVTVEDQQAPLQASPETLALWIDADGRSETGAQMSDPAEASALGVDLVVEFSPAGEQGRPAPGSAAFAVNAAGVRTPLNPAVLDLAASPTHGAPVYEVRIARHAQAEIPASLHRLLSARGRASAMVVLSGADGRVVGWSDPEGFALPAAAAERELANVVVPAKPAGSVRVLSYNVFKSKLLDNPSPFARIIQVTQPDIILLQEWGADEATARAWFTAVVTGEHDWNAAAGASDVLIVSPHPIQEVGPDVVTTDESMGAEPRPVRVVGALVGTPAGTVAVATMHLKCCGTAGSPEDARRSAEARAINGAFGPAFQSAGPRLALMGGDINLVGTRTPLDLLRLRMDLDGSEMAVADPIVLGDAAMTTWRDPATPFPPGRLDYIIYSDSVAEVVNAFVLDTSRLSDRSLARMGLDRGDSASSDHLPLIVDLKPR